MDLSDALVEITVRRYDNHGGHRYAVFSSIGGFEMGRELFVSPYFDSWSTEDAALQFKLPADGFADIESPFEFRIYTFEAQYYGKETSVAGFVLHGAVHESKPPVPAESLHVSELTLEKLQVNKLLRKAKASVRVSDNLGDPVSGAVVTGSFSAKKMKETVTGTTGDDGVAVLTTSETFKKKTSVTFCVDSITDANLPYAPDNNVLSCKTE